MALGTPVQRGSGTGTVTATTGSFTPTANSSLLVIAGARRSTTTAPTKPVITDSLGLTWSTVLDAQLAEGSSATYRITVSRAEIGASPAAMTVTADSASSQATGLGAFDITGLAATLLNFGSGTSTSGDPSAVLPTAPAATSIVLSGIAAGAAAGSAAVPTGFTELFDVLAASLLIVEGAYDATSPPTTVTYATTGARSVGFALELKAVAAPSTNASGLPWPSGSYSGQSGWEAFRGRADDWRLSFFGRNPGWESLYTVDSAWRNANAITDDVASAAAAGKGLAIALPLLGAQDRQNFAKIVAGSLDGLHTDMANAILANSVPGQKIAIRLGHEANAGTPGRYPWHFIDPTTGPADPTTYRTAWRRIALIYKAILSTRVLMMDWNLIHQHQGGYDGYSLESYYPGNDAVDIVGMDMYDNGGSSNTFFFDNDTDWVKALGNYDSAAGKAYGLQGVFDFARAHGKLFSVPEWAPMSDGTVGDDCNNPYFPPHLFDFFAANAEYIAYECYFNYATAEEIAAGNEQHRINPAVPHLLITRAAYQAAYTPGDDTSGSGGGILTAPVGLGGAGHSAFSVGAPIPLGQGGGFLTTPAITGTFTPTAGSYVLVIVATRRNSTVAAPVPVVTNNGGLTFTQVADATYDGVSPSLRLTVFRAAAGGEPVAMSVTSTQNLANTNGIVALQTSGHTLDFSNFASAGNVAGGPEVVLDTAPAEGSFTLAMGVFAPAGPNTADLPNAFTSLVNFQPGPELIVHAGYDNTTPEQTVSWSTANARSLTALLELKDTNAAGAPVGTPVLLTAGGALGATATTPSFTPSADSTMLAFVAVRRGAAIAADTIVDSRGGAWTLLKTIDYMHTSGTWIRLASYWKSSNLTTPGARTVTVTSTGAGHIAVLVVELTSIAALDHWASGTDNDGDPSATFGLAPDADSGVISCMAAIGNVSCAPPGGWTEIYDAEPEAGGGLHLALAYNLTGNTPGIAWTSTNTGAAAQIIDLKAIRSQGGRGTLGASVNLGGAGVKVSAAGVPILRGQGGGTTTAVTSAFTPTAASILIAIVGGRRTTTAPGQPTCIDSLGLTWTAINEATYDAGAGELLRMRAFYTQIGGSPASMTVTGGVANASSCGVSVVQIVQDNINFTNSGFVGDAAGDPTGNLPTAIADGSILLGGVVMAGTAAITSPSGFTPLNEFTAGTALRMETAFTLNPPKSTAWANGYACRIPVTLNARTGGPSVANFLLPFSDVREEFKQSENGGQVTHASGWDIRFELTNGTKLPHKIITYDGSEGLLLATVNVPWNMASSLPAYCYVGKLDIAGPEADAALAAAGGWLALYAGAIGPSHTGVTGRALRPYTPPSSGKWWHYSDMPGERANGRLSGVSYWGSSTKPWPDGPETYNRQVGYADGWNGQHTFDGAPEQSTMRKITGGQTTVLDPTGAIEADSYLDWAGKTTTNWVTGWYRMPAGTIGSWTMNMISNDYAEHTTPADPYQHIDPNFFTKSENGDFDIAFTNMGYRLKKIFDSTTLNPRRHKANRIFFRMNHENNQSSARKIRVVDKARYVLAMDRAIDCIRIGLGPVHGSTDPRVGLHFMNAPGREGNSNYGSYESWEPTRCDTISVSFHPTRQDTTQARVTDYIENTTEARFYSLKKLLVYAKSSNKPIMMPEWNAQNAIEDDKDGIIQLDEIKCNPVAHLVNITLDTWLKAIDPVDGTRNQSWIICDMVFEATAINENGYKDPTNRYNTQIDGNANWAKGVKEYKARWAGTKRLV